MTLKITPTEESQGTSGYSLDFQICEESVKVFEAKDRLERIRQNVAKIFESRMDTSFHVGEKVYDAKRIVNKIVRLEKKLKKRFHEIQTSITSAMSEQEQKRIIERCISFVKKVKFFDHIKLPVILRNLPEETAVRPTSPPLPINPSGETPLLSMKELWERFIPRLLEKRYDCWAGDGQPFECVRYTLHEHEQDKKILKEILKNHNRQFHSLARISSGVMDQEGFIEKLEVDKGTTLFVRADLHGDSISLCYLLRLLKESQYLDEAFRCSPSFHVILLGDFTDRGFNDIETLSLVLRWRMENPEQVHLISGNHEDVEMQVKYSQEEEWIRAHKAALEDCYATLPSALFVASMEGRQDKGGRREYRHFSHGCFSPSFDPIPFLLSNRRFMSLEKRPPLSERLKTLAKIKEGEDGHQDTRCESARMFLRARELEETVQRESQESGTIHYTYLWADVRESLNLVEHNDMRMGGIQLHPQLLLAYRMIGDEKACIKGLDLGHSHRYQEFIESKGKVFATTLPVAPIEWRDRQEFVDLKIQGFLYYVAPRMKDWEKRPLYYQLIGPRFAWDPQKYGMYTRFS